MAHLDDPFIYEKHNKNPYTGQKSRGVYDLVSIPDVQTQAQKNCLSSFTNLTLLKAEEDEDEEVVEEVQTERPVTPINETIRGPPKTFQALCRHVRRRINPRPYWTHISIEDQRSLGAVLLGEVNAIWSVFRQQVDDPFLTSRQNKELQRRITVHIVSVCEQLFLYFCNQVKVLNARGVFSEAANMSRIRGQIALCADKYLNLLSVRRHIIADIKKTTERDTMFVKRKEAVTPVPPKAPRHLSFQNLIATSRTTLATQDFNIVEEIKDMKKRMPILDLSTAVSLLPIKPSQSMYDDNILPEDTSEDESLESKEESLLLPRKIRKWESEPLLHIEGLLDEPPLQDGLQSPSVHSRIASAVKATSSATLEVHSAREVYSAPPLHFSSSGAIDGDKSSTIDPKQDLAKLIQSQTMVTNDNTYLEEQQGIPPLIQAITRREMQDEKLKRMKEEEVELDQRRLRFEEEERKPLPEPKYPQPPVVQIKIPGYANPVDKKNVTIRSSDIHIPDRVDLPDVSLSLHGPLYNDLIGEISPATVKELDANLFQGEELKEVYDEIMKTVPDEHLLFDRDPLVMKPAEGIDVNKVLASSTLTRPRSQQIINPAFKKEGAQPPWGLQAHDTWERNNKPSISGDTSYTESHMVHVANSTMDGPKPDRANRAYASWLAWWKATVNTDDYFKYLSTKETDYLSAIFHFYDSEASSSDANVSEQSALLMEERKHELFLNEVKSKKEHFVRGLWNVTSVTMGGLGKCPDLEEYESFFRKPRIDEDSVSVAASTEIESSGAAPTSHTDESADSESSIRAVTSNRRKTMSPRRRIRSRLHDNLLATSEEESGTEFARESSRRLSHLDNVQNGLIDTVSSALETDDSLALPQHFNSEKMPEGSSADQESIENEEVKSSSQDVVECTSEEFLEIIQHLKAESKDDDTCDTGVETDMSIADRSGPANAYNQARFSNDEYTSGYMSLDSNVPAYPPSVQFRRRLSSRRRSSRAEGKQSAAAEWKISMVVQRHLQSYLPKTNYKSRSNSIVTSSKVSMLDKTTSSHTVSPSLSNFRPAASRLQQRFESVWKQLKMTSSQKLNAALKYSSDQFMPMLEEIVKSWEHVTELILKREKILHGLEVFEREASDPHRFFSKGTKGSSAARLMEAKKRAKIYHKLEGLESKISPLLYSIHTHYHDVVTFETRPYHEKMSMDRTEMLYWLQQERRCRLLDMQGQSEQLKQFMRDNHMTVTKTNPVTKQQLPMPISHISIDQKT